MRILKTLGAMALPLAATLMAASLASADHLIAYMEGTGLSQGAYPYNCNIVASNGVRAHIQTYADGENIYNIYPQSTYTVQSGISGDTTMYYPGKRHKATLSSHLIDTGSGQEIYLQHCASGWTAGFASSGTTNVGNCNSNIYSSTGSTSGSCSTRTFKAYSMGNTNP